MRTLNKIKTLLKTLNLQQQRDAAKERMIAKLTEGKNAQFHGNNQIKNSTIGLNSYVSFNSIVFNCDILNYCSIGPNVVIGYGDHPYHFLSTSPHIYLNRTFFSENEIEGILKPHFERVKIGNDVWIGANVYIKNGITIGDGAIIGAGAVVTKDVQPFSIVGGVPARVINKRFSDEIISLILETQWWKLDISELDSYKSFIRNPSKANFLMIKSKE